MAFQNLHPQEITIPSMGEYELHVIYDCVVLQNDIITYYRDISQAQMQFIAGYFLNISQQLRKSLWENWKLAKFYKKTKNGLASKMQSPKKETI